MNKGATIWARQTIDSEIFYNKPDKWFKIWFYLVNRVNHKKTGKFDRGECFIIYSEIAEKTNATPDQIKKALGFFRSRTMIDTQRSTRGVTLKILNYSHYQDLNNYKNEEQSTTGSTRKALEKHQRSTPIVKNVKNVKNVVTKVTSNEVAGVKELMDVFYKINPTINWGNKTTRGAAEFMIKKFGLDTTLKMAEQIVAVQGQPYAPVATTPYQMKEKLAQFKVYFDSQKNKQEKSSVTKIS